MAETLVLESFVLFVVRIYATYRAFLRVLHPFSKFELGILFINELQKGVDCAEDFPYCLLINPCVTEAPP